MTVNERHWFTLLQVDHSANLPGFGNFCRFFHGLMSISRVADRSNPLKTPFTSQWFIDRRFGRAILSDIRQNVDCIASSW